VREQRHDEASPWQALGVIGAGRGCTSQSRKKASQEQYKRREGCLLCTPRRGTCHTLTACLSQAHAQKHSPSLNLRHCWMGRKTVWGSGR